MYKKASRFTSANDSKSPRTFLLLLNFPLFLLISPKHTVEVIAFSVLERGGYFLCVLLFLQFSLITFEEDSPLFSFVFSDDDRVSIKFCWQQRSPTFSTHSLFSLPGNFGLTGEDTACTSSIMLSEEVATEQKKTGTTLLELNELVYCSVGKCQMDDCNYWCLKK